MNEVLGFVAVALLLAVLVVQIICLLRMNKPKEDQTKPILDALHQGQERTERAVRDELGKNREESEKRSRALREEVGQTLKGVSDSLIKTVGELSTSQGQRLESFGKQLNKLTETNETKLDALRTAVEQKLTRLQDDNMKKLEEMRKTVDEKLHGTLEKRLGESFKIVSDRLEQVHKGLGEMQTLANGVGDLKKVLTNVKTRGTWGEIQLGNLLEQILTPEQYETNVATTGGRERVEFAIKLPGHDPDQDGIVWLPIDAKFPKEDYERIRDAADRSDAEAVEAACKQLEIRVKACAKDIRDKYVAPPLTTEFAIMFLPSEGLYAEVLRRPGLVDLLQREHRVTVAGPMTIAGLLNSLQMGFRTLAIQKRSSEVWGVLAEVKTEFGKFGPAIDKVQKKLKEASNVIDQAGRRSRAMERKLKGVEKLTNGDDGVLLLDAEALLPDETEED